MRPRHILAWSAVMAVALAGAAVATPLPNGTTVEIRTFNDCPLSIVSVLNNYPATISITDQMNPACLGYANLHSWTFSEDGGATPAVFGNNASFRYGADFMIDGAGEGEGGLRLSPWWSQFVDGRFMVNATTGEIACFGGRLPFYSFTTSHGVAYVRGTTIRMEMIYLANALSAADPATIQYRLILGGTAYESPVLPFDQGNPAEDPPYGLWGILNDARVGGYFQPRANTGTSLAATWSNVTFTPLATPSPSAAHFAIRTFNDCPLSILTVVDDYPAFVAITDDMNPACLGFANLHSWSFSDDGGATAAVFNNASTFSFGADFSIHGPGEGEGGLRLSPWWAPYVDGRFMVNATTGEIACFGGRLPFYNFTANHGLTYVKGATLRLEVTYLANGLSAADPATIQYRVIVGGTSYDSPVLPFDQGNPAEDPPFGLWGILNDARAGGYFQPRANTGTSLTATWSNISFNSCPVTVEFAFNPGSFNVNSMGRWVTGYLEPPPGYSASDIDIGSILLNGSVPVAIGAPTSIGDADEDGILDLMVKFDRVAAGMTLEEGSAVPVTVTGLIAGTCFEGLDMIRVKGSVMSAPRARQIVERGSRVDVAWQADPGVAVVDFIASFDNGATWQVEALGIPNTGAYRWRVPNVTSNTARVAVVVIAAVTRSDIVRKAELAESETFAILKTVAVGDGGRRVFALHGVHPNPAVGDLHVTFSLPDASQAMLSVYDVAGRKIIEQQVGDLGPGTHSVTIGDRKLAAGVYLVRLSQAARSFATRAIVVE